MGYDSITELIIHIQKIKTCTIVLYVTETVVCTRSLMIGKPQHSWQLKICN